MSILSKVIGKVFGNKSEKDLNVLLPYLDEINSHYDKLSTLKDDDLKNKFQKIKKDFLELINSNKNQK